MRRRCSGPAAGNASDNLRDAAVAGYLLVALAAPGETATGKLTDLGAGVVTLYAQGAVVNGLKEVTGRRRPDGSNRMSFPSGHTSTASAAAALAIGQLEHIDLPPPARNAMAIGFEALAAGTGWARVEARKHHVVDVLAGYAVGHFVAAVAQQALMRPLTPEAQIAFHPIPGGGALRLTVPVALRR